MAPRAIGSRVACRRGRVQPELIKRATSRFCKARAHPRSWCSRNRRARSAPPVPAAHRGTAVYTSEARSRRAFATDAAAGAGLLDAQFPELGDRPRQHLWDAATTSYYQAQQAVPVVETLVCDDAPQFKGITADLSLCWVHEGRHYKKLSPVVPPHQQALTRFRGRFWAYYRELRAYQQAPALGAAARLDAAFDTLFATTTGYAALDERIAKKQALLRVLDKPYLPLTNNPAELGARRRVRKRDVSVGPRSPTGLGYLPYPHRHRPTAGRQCAALSPGPLLRHLPPACAGRPHPPTRHRPCSRPGHRCCLTP